MGAVITASGHTIIENLVVARTHFAKFRGLMFRSQLPSDEGLLIPKCNAIHCCFMRIPIDVLFLDDAYTIVHTIPNMRPWTFSKFVRNGRHVLECSAGTIAKHQLSVGQVLNLH